LESGSSISSTLCPDSRLLGLLHAQPEGDIFVDGHVREDGIVLEDHRKAAIFRRQADHRPLADADIA